MRTLFEIVEDLKTGGKPEYDELKYALLAYVSLFNIEHGQLCNVLSQDKELSKPIKDKKLQNSFDMYKGALSKNPKEWLGWNNDPDNPEYIRRIKTDVDCDVTDEEINNGTL